MQVDYQVIKTLAKEIGCKVGDLLALSPGNDPFYSDIPFRVEASEWFAGLWDQFGFGHGTHIRRVHYVVSSQHPPITKPDGTDYENTERDWKFLGVASLAARYRGLIPAEAIVDNRNAPPKIFAKMELTDTEWEVSVDATDIASKWWMPDFPGIPDFSLTDFDRGQAYIVEVWVEKSTQDDILVPLCRRLGVNLVVGAGELSEVACRGLLNRVVHAERPGRVIYISDFDPAGRSMPVAVARKLEYYIRTAELDVDVSLNPIALTERQCIDFSLPRIPIKETERRAAKFEERFGVGATELDALEALHPGSLAHIVEAEATRWIDTTLASRVSLARVSFVEGLDAIQEEVTERHADAIADLRAEFDRIYEDLRAWRELAQPLWGAIADDLAAVDISDAQEPVPECRTADEPDAPLFDSSRDYLSQLDHYRRWQGRFDGEDEG